MTARARKRRLDVGYFAYIRAWARLVVRLRRPSIIGVTGSVGKTTTTEIIGAALMHEAVRPYVGDVWKTNRNMNDFAGFPLTVLGYRAWPRRGWRSRLAQLVSVPARAAALTTVRSYPRWMVLEYAVGTSLSNVRTLAADAPPTIAVVTAVGPAHLDQFGTVEAVAANKRALVEAVPPDGLVILGADNAHAAAMASASRAPVRLVPGRGREFAQAAARIIGEHLGVPPDAMERALAAPVALKRRQELHALGAIRVLDDGFNANPLSMGYGLTSFAESAEPGERRVAILGQMAELGAASADYHREVGAQARRCADLLVGVGPQAKLYEPDHWYESSADCAAAVPSLVRAGDFVFLKGSGSVKMRLVTQALLALGPTLDAADRPAGGASPAE